MTIPTYATEVALWGGPADGQLTALLSMENEPPLWHDVYTGPDLVNGQVRKRVHRYLRTVNTSGRGPLWLYCYQGERRDG